VHGGQVTSQPVPGMSTQEMFANGNEQRRSVTLLNRCLSAYVNIVRRARRFINILVVSVNTKKVENKRQE